MELLVTMILISEGEIYHIIGENEANMAPIQVEAWHYSVGRPLLEIFLFLLAPPPFLLTFLMIFPMGSPTRFSCSIVLLFQMFTVHSDSTRKLELQSDLI